MAKRFRSKKARVGSDNGRTRLDDGAVRMIRAFVAFDVDSRREIARAYAITERHVTRLASGQRRAEAGGVMRQAGDVAAEIRVLSVHSGTTAIRCTGCGAKALPSEIDPTRCMLCARRESSQAA